MTDPLTRLAILHGTDKFGFHHYTPRYVDLLRPLRKQPIKLLEIGVGGYGEAHRGGESLAMWRDFFPKAQITGLDIARKSLDLGPRVEIRQGSQDDAECLAQLVGERGPFDVILDDGSHQNGHVVESYRRLFPDLASGGIYIIEDVQTAVFPNFGGSLALETPNSVGMMLDRAARLQAGQGGGIGWIERFHNLIIVHKRVARQQRPTADGDRHLKAAEAAQRPVLSAEAGDLAEPGRLERLVDQAGEGGIILLHGQWPDPDLLRDLFLQVDHREIRVHFPDAPLHDRAERIAGLAIYPEAVVLLVGENSYPSCFAFDARHPQVVAALAEMGEVLKDDSAGEAALLRYLRLRDLPGGGGVGIELLDRLQAMGCRDPIYRLRRAEILASRGQWGDLLQLCQLAVEQGATDPRLTAHLALALRRTGQGPRALQLLRAAHARMPQALPIISALADAEFADGDARNAKELLAGAIDRLAPDEQPGRLRDLIQMARAAGDAQAALAAAIRLGRIDPDAVSITRAPAPGA